MGYFANDRIKKGKAAAKAGCSESMPKNYSPKAGTPQNTPTKGTATTLPTNQASSPYSMNTAQIKNSKKQQ